MNPANPYDSVVAQVINRAASPGYERWWARVTDAGFCAVPVHLEGHGADHSPAYALARCKNRRASVCPSCSQLYAGDTWQLVHSGIAGGAGFETVADPPMVFATLTAPSFGRVHASPHTGNGASRACHPEAGAGRCRHGRSASCRAIHDHADPMVGQPLCADCYDYEGHVLFTWHAPQLWHRFAVSLRRLVGRRRRDLGEDPGNVRVAYVKVVEMQRRATPHFHAVIRLDAGTGSGDRVASLGTAIDANDLAVLVHRAAAASCVRVSSLGRAQRTVCFGEQIDTRPVVCTVGVDGHFGDDCVGALVLPARRVAAYLAKYVTKSVAEHGLAARRIHEGVIDELDVTDHVRRILHTIARLSKQPERRDMAAWFHTLGYRGHITTKTRRYSTTMGALRKRRTDWRRQQRDQAEAVGPEEPTSETMIDWQYVGCGHTNEGERLLAVTAAEQTREMRRTARAELADEPGGADRWRSNAS